MSSSEVPLSLNDPVAIESSSSSLQLHGVVAYLGPVEFASGVTDYVGVRLTSASVGLGKNDGMVDGKRYFDAGPNGGMFVRYSSGKLSKRSLTRLQELQLKRELGIRATSSTATAAPSLTSAEILSPPAPVKVKREAPRTPSSTTIDMATPSSSAAKGGTKSKLEEIRKRREAALATNAKVSVQSAKSGTDDNQDAASATSSTSSSFTSPIASAPGTKFVSSASSNRSSRLEDLRLGRESRLVRSATTSPIDAQSLTSPRPKSSSPLASEASQANAEYEVKLKDLKNVLQQKESEISRLNAALQDFELKMQTSDLKANELQEALESLKQTQALQKSPARTKPDMEDQADSPAAQLSEITYTQEYIDNIISEKQNLQQKLDDALANIQPLQRELSEDKENRAAEVFNLRQELAGAKSRALAAEKEVQIMSEQTELKSTNAADYLKERAKLNSEISTLNRRISELEATVTEHETAVEELVLDKEALQEEKEELFDQLQERTIEVTSLQVELEEAKVDLEEAKIALEEAQQSYTMMGAGSRDDGTGTGKSASSTEADVQDMTKALSTQNARLREALLRLREQSNIEKMELGKQLRVAEKDAVTGRELLAEVQALRETKAKQISEIKELKEMVDVNNVYESMVEELSDKVVRLEDENIELRNAIRDLEEAGELSAEMEEVQAEENKTLRLNVEKRDTLIRNLEEAIKMQRRREEDLQRTIGNYRSVIDTLREEQASLLAVRDGGEGEKNHLLAMSQRALAQAAQLVSDQAALRKLEAMAVFDRINAQVVTHLSMRLESLLPGESYIAAEITSMKGELLLSKIAAKASAGLRSLEECFRKAVGSTSQAGVSREANSAGSRLSNQRNIPLSDEAFQQVETMIHQGKCSRVMIDASANCFLLLCIGQWPKLLTSDESRTLGSSVLGPSSVVDNLLSQQLRMLKEEGYLSPHRSSLAALEESILVMKSSLIENEEHVVVPPDWRNKPGWNIIKEATAAKYLCLASLAAISSAIAPSDENSINNDQGSDEIVAVLSDVRNKVDRISKEVERTAGRLVNLPLDGESSSLKAVAEASFALSSDASALLESIHQLFSKESVNVEVIGKAETLAERTLNSLLAFSSSLKDAGIVGAETAKVHPISPENDNPWDSVVQFALKSGDVNKDDERAVTFRARARFVEQKIANAIESETRLATAVSKLASLEKSLATRSQEIVMQNARMIELEKFLAEAHTSQTKESRELASYIAPTDTSSSENLAKLTEENWVLTEAIDVLHTQVDEYEAEIRSLRESGGKSLSRRTMFTSPRGRSGGGASDLDSTLYLLGQDIGGESVSKAPAPISLANAVKLEAALFRPALQAACAEVAIWKAKAIENKMASLPPLSVPNFIGLGSSQPQDGDEASAPVSRMDSKLLQCKEELILATAQIRLAKATISVVDLTKCKTAAESASTSGKPSTRMQYPSSRKELREQRAKEKLATQRLEDAKSTARSCLSKLSGTSDLGGAWLLPFEMSTRVA